MKSDFEKRAAQAAVDAVESRYRRNRQQERQMRRRRRLGPVLIFVLILAAGYACWQYFGSGGFSSLKALSALAGLNSADPTAAVRLQYGHTLKLLLVGEVKLLSEMPEAFKIKNAKPGVRFAVLTAPADGWFGVYELERAATGELTVRELSPVASPRPVTAADLRAACEGKPHLVAVDGQVYLSASKDLAEAEKLREAVRALACGGK